MAISPQGYRYGKDPKSDHPFWDAVKEIISKITGTASVDDTTGTPSVEVTNTETDDAINFDFAFSGLKGEKGDTGETGPQGPQGEAGPDYNAVVSTTITNENGVYSVSNTMHDGTTQEVGTIETTSLDEANVVAEITDSVVEDNTNGYDFHTLKETQYDGTQNEVGKFYLAQKQYINPFVSIGDSGYALYDSYVDQAGNMHNVFDGVIIPRTVSVNYTEPEVHSAGNYLLNITFTAGTRKNVKATVFYAYDGTNTSYSTLGVARGYANNTYFVFCRGFQLSSESNRTLNVYILPITASAYLSEEYSVTSTAWTLIS